VDYKTKTKKYEEFKKGYPMQNSGHSFHNPGLTISITRVTFW
jgi:hypothetical protein